MGGVVETELHEQGSSPNNNKSTVPVYPWKPHMAESPVSLNQQGDKPATSQRAETSRKLPKVV